MILRMRYVVFVMWIGFVECCWMFSMLKWLNMSVLVIWLMMISVSVVVVFRCGIIRIVMLMNIVLNIFFV